MTLSNRLQKTVWRLFVAVPLLALGLIPVGCEYYTEAPSPNDVIVKTPEGGIAPAADPASDPVTQPGGGTTMPEEVNPTEEAGTIGQGEMATSEENGGEAAGSTGGTMPPIFPEGVTPMIPQPTDSNLKNVISFLFPSGETGDLEPPTVEDWNLKPPAVANTYPEQGWEVGANSGVSVTFTEEIDPSSITKDSLSLTPSVAVAGIYTDDNTTIGFFLVPGLEAGVTYLAMLKKDGIKDMNGNLMQQDYVWLFDTKK